MSDKAVRAQFAHTMVAVGAEDPDLVVLVGDISHTILQPYSRACPGRYYNIGICEPTIMSMGAGLAKVGFVPVIHTIAPFLLERSFEQIKLDFCYQRLSGNIVTVGSAFDYANLGCTHHCYGDFAMLKTLPSTEIVYPSSAVEFDALFRQGYRRPGVKVFRIPAKTHGLSLEPADLRYGRLLRVAEGTDLTIVATGPQLATALGAREILKARGWDPEILYAHTVRPLDEEALRESVKKTRRVVVIEEHMRHGGLGDDVLRAVHGLGGVAFSSLAIPGNFIHEYGRYEDHCARLGFTPEGLASYVSSGFARPAASGGTHG